MKKILIIGFYEPKEYISKITEQLQGFKFEVETYPLFRYMYDKNDKRSDYREDMDSFIGTYNPDIILWIFLIAPYELFQFVREKYNSLYFVMLNMDDPNNYNTNIHAISRFFDLVVTPCAENKYNNNAVYIPHGFDDSIYQPTHKLLDVRDYNNNINVFCGDTFHEKFINNLSVYGPTVYGSNFNILPGDDTLNGVINKSRMNICLHGDLTKDRYLMSTVFKVLGAGGLLVVDKVKGIESILQHGINCVVLDDDNYIQQINDILMNYGRYSTIKSNGYQLSKQFTFSIWTEKFVHAISRKFFSARAYSSLNKLNLSNFSPWEHWCNIGVKNRYIFYDLVVPDAFDDRIYGTHIKDDKSSKEYLYYHWMLNGKDQKFLNKTKSNDNLMNVNIEKFNVSPDKFFEINQIFEDVSKTGSVDDFKRLDRLCKENPGIKVNELLDLYMQYHAA